MSKSKSKYYVVWNGHTPGIYESWADCQLQIKGYPNAKFKSFKTKEQAVKAYKESFAEYIGKNAKKHSATQLIEHLPIVKRSICVDAACSGNPGLMEYRGVVTMTGDQIFHKGPIKYGTNNIGEFLALVHGLALLYKRDDSETAIYSDSRTAMAWVRNKKVKTTLKKNSETELLFELLERAVNWLENNQFKTKILKWETEEWGEIPADFGRK